MFTSRRVARPKPRRYKLFISHAWDDHDHYVRLVRVLHAQPDFAWDNHSVPKDDPLHRRSPTALREGLRRQLHYCHALLVIAGMDAPSSKWMREEIEIAASYGKPIIAVRPYGAPSTPRAVREACDTTVGWRGTSIVDAVKTWVT